MLEIRHYNSIHGDDYDTLFAVLADMEQEVFADAWTKTMLEESMQQPYNHLWIVRDEGLCGYLVANVIADESELLRIAVDQAYRRSGIGKMLMESYLAFVRENCTRGLLEVRHGNEAAKKLYEMYGYTPLATRKRYYNNPVEDADIYEVIV